MSKISLLWAVLLLSGCAFSPPQATQPSDSPRVPVNASMPPFLQDV